jgi:hypothetical protein
MTYDFTIFSYLVIFQIFLVKLKIMWGRRCCSYLHQWQQRTAFIRLCRQLSGENSAVALADSDQKGSRKLPAAGPAFRDFIVGDKQRVKIYPEIPPYIHPDTLRKVALKKTKDINVKKEWFDPPLPYLSFFQ